MTRFLASAALAVAAIVPAAADAASYAARPVASPATSRIIARDISWACGPEACLGTTAESRPLVLCQGLAKKAGPIASFLVDGRALAAAELARCNSAARGGAPAALAGK